MNLSELFPTLIPDWKTAYKLTSVQVSLVVSLLGVLDGLLPQLFGANMFSLITAVGGLVVILARVTIQPKLVAAAAAKDATTTPDVKTDDVQS